MKEGRTNHIMTDNIDIDKLDADTQGKREKLRGQIRAGAYLRQLRQERELSLATLGKQLGVSSAYLSNVEQGVKAMNDYFVRQISGYFQINENNIFDLLGRVPLLAREQLEENEHLQSLLVEIKSNPKLTDEKKQRLISQMYELYKKFQ